MQQSLTRRPTELTALTSITTSITACSSSNRRRVNCGSTVDSPPAVKRRRPLNTPTFNHRNVMPSSDLDTVPHGFTFNHVGSADLGLKALSRQRWTEANWRGTTDPYPPAPDSPADRRRPKKSTSFRLSSTLTGFFHQQHQKKSQQRASKIDSKSGLKRSNTVAKDCQVNYAEKCNNKKTSSSSSIFRSFFAHQGEGKNGKVAPPVDLWIDVNQRQWDNTEFSPAVPSWMLPSSVSAAHESSTRPVSTSRCAAATVEAEELRRPLAVVRRSNSVRPASRKPSMLRSDVPELVSRPAVESMEQDYRQNSAIGNCYTKQSPDHCVETMDWLETFSPPEQNQRQQQQRSIEHMKFLYSQPSRSANVEPSVACISTSHNLRPTQLELPSTSPHGLTPSLHLPSTSIAGSFPLENCQESCQQTYAMSSPATAAAAAYESSGRRLPPTIKDGSLSLPRQRVSRVNLEKSASISAHSLPSVKCEKVALKPSAPATDVKKISSQTSKMQTLSTEEWLDALHSQNNYSLVKLRQHSPGVASSPTALSNVALKPSVSNSCQQAVHESKKSGNAKMMDAVLCNPMIGDIDSHHKFPAKSPTSSDTEVWLNSLHRKKNVQNCTASNHGKFSAEELPQSCPVNITVNVSRQSSKREPSMTSQELKSQQSVGASRSEWVAITIDNECCAAGPQRNSNPAERSGSFFTKVRRAVVGSLGALFGIGRQKHDVPVPPVDSGRRSGDPDSQDFDQLTEIEKLAAVADRIATDRQIAAAHGMTASISGANSLQRNQRCAVSALLTPTEFVDLQSSFAGLNMKEKEKEKERRSSGGFDPCIKPYDSRSLRRPSPTTYVQFIPKSLPSVNVNNVSTNCLVGPPHLSVHHPMDRSSPEYSGSTSASRLPLPSGGRALPSADSIVAPPRLQSPTSSLPRSYMERSKVRQVERLNPSSSATTKSSKDLLIQSSNPSSEKETCSDAGRIESKVHSGLPVPAQNNSPVSHSSPIDEKVEKVNTGHIQVQSVASEKLLPPFSSFARSLFLSSGGTVAGQMPTGPCHTESWTAAGNFSLVSIKPKPPPKPDLKSLGHVSWKQTTSTGATKPQNSLPQHRHTAGASGLVSVLPDSEPSSEGSCTKRWTLQDISVMVENELKANECLNADESRSQPSATQPRLLCSSTSVGKETVCPELTSRQSAKIQSNPENDEVFSSDTKVLETDEEDDRASTATLTEQTFDSRATSNTNTPTLLRQPDFSTANFPDDDFDICSSEESLKNFGLRTEMVDRALRSSLLSQSHSLSAISDVLRADRTGLTDMSPSMNSPPRAASISTDIPVKVKEASRPKQINLPGTSRFPFRDPLPGGATGLNGPGGMELLLQTSPYNSNSSGIGSSCGDVASIPNSPL